MMRSCASIGSGNVRPPVHTSSFVMKPGCHMGDGRPPGWVGRPLVVSSAFEPVSRGLASELAEGSVEAPPD